MKIASRFSPTQKWLLGGLLAADLAVFAGTNPRSVPSWALIIGFVLLVANFYVLLLAALRLVSWYGLAPGRHRKRFIRLAAVSFAIVVALQSIGGLGPRDVLVAVPLLVVAYLYISYGRASRLPEAAPPPAI